MTSYNEQDQKPEDKKNEAESHEQQSADSEKVRIEFPYSEVVRSQLPKVFEVAEKVATDWKNEGEFSNLGLPHPLADVVAAEALKRAKKVEKKLEEKGVFTLAKMGMEIAKSQFEQIKRKKNEP